MKTPSSAGAPVGIAAVASADRVLAPPGCRRTDRRRQVLSAGC